MRQKSKGAAVLQALLVFVVMSFTIFIGFPLASADPIRNGFEQAGSCEEADLDVLSVWRFYATGEAGFNRPDGSYSYCDVTNRGQYNNLNGVRLQLFVGAIAAMIALLFLGIGIVVKGPFTAEDYKQGIVATVGIALLALVGAVFIFIYLFILAAFFLGSFLLLWGVASRD